MSILETHRGEVAQAVRNHRYELTEDGGVFMPAAKVFVGGALTFIDNRADGVQSIDCNKLSLEGLTHFLNSGMQPSGGYPATAQWYYAPFKNDFTPDGSETAATFPAAAGEFTAYTNATRLPVTIGAAATTPVAGSTANSTLVFSAGAPGVTYDIYGAAIVSGQAKSATSGKLLACVRLDAPRLGFKAGDNIALGYQLTAADAG